MSSYEKSNMNPGFCEVYLDGKWIVIECLWDRELFEIISGKGFDCYDFTSGKFDWDGKTNIELDRKWIAEDIGTFASADELLKNNPMQLYLGFNLFTISSMIFTANMIIIILGIYSIIIYHLIIIEEEKFLVQRFGDKYIEYKKQVRRYI